MSELTELSHVKSMAGMSDEKKREKLAFTLKMLEAMKKYAEQLAGLDASEPVHYEGRKFDGFLSAVILEDGLLCNAINLGGVDVANIVSGLVDGLIERSKNNPKAMMLVGLLGAKLMAASVKAIKDDDSDDDDEKPDDKPKPEGDIKCDPQSSVH